MNIRVYVLSKNEEVNIKECIETLISSGLDQITLVDSGSTDATLDIVSEYAISVSSYSYIDHAKAYNDITGNSPADQLSMILDADMRVSSGLVDELEKIADKETSATVFEFPVRMVYEGVELEHASLYPPKSIVFRGGNEYFYSIGHGEALVAGTQVCRGKTSFIHDDKKSLSAFMSNQIRYADKIVAISENGMSSWKDKIRMKTPFGALAVFLKSYVLQRGFLDGKAGLIYNIDRVIAELIVYRASVKSSLKSTS